MRTKTTAAMDKVLRRMKKGAYLVTCGVIGGWSLFLGGRFIAAVHHGTAYGLRDRGLIEQTHERWPKIFYKIKLDEG